MKKYSSLFIISVCVFSLSAGIALAQNSLKVNPMDLFKQDREQVKNQIENARQEKAQVKETLKNELDTKRQEMQTTLDSAKQKIADLKAKIKTEKNAAKAKAAEQRILGREEALKRFDAAIEKVTALKDKVDGTLAKHEANGLDTTAARNFVTTAQAKIDEAKTKTAEAYTLLGTSTNQLSAESKTKLQTLAKETQDSIVAARGALNDAVKSLKETIKAKIESIKNLPTQESAAENNVGTESAN